MDLVRMQNSTDELVKILKTRYEHLKGRRGTWETHWQEIADLMHPFDDNFVSYESPGSEKMTFVFDSTPIHANQLLASGLFSMLTSPAQKWFEMRMVVEYLNHVREVQLWLHEVSAIMYHEINKQNTHFNTAMHELYLEYGAFGNGILYVTESQDKQSLRFQALPLSESYLCEGSEGLMDALFRKYPRSVRQLAQKFGLERMSEPVQKLYNDKKLDQIVKCCHAIVPTSDYGVRFPLPYISAYIDMKHNHFIAGSGYYELPIMAPRFYKNPWEVYGRGPGTTALPDIKMLQEVMRTTIRAAQKVTDPPLMAPDEGFLNPVRTTPGGINFYRAGTVDRIEPINFGSDIGVGADIITDLRARIREIFFIDQLQLQEGPQMTATEVLQRTEEKLRLMGPLMGRLQSELLNPMLNRVFGILSRQGKIPPAPEVIQDQEMDVTYTSPIARAQEQTEANGIMRSLQILTPFLDMDPTAVDRFHTDNLTKGVWEMFSVNPNFLRSDEETAAIRQGKLEREAQAQQAANVQSAGQGFESITRAGINLQELTGGGE